MRQPNPHRTQHHNTNHGSDRDRPTMGHRRRIRSNRKHVFPQGRGRVARRCWRVDHSMYAAEVGEVLAARDDERVF
jgi:hypothetical protein